MTIATVTFLPDGQTQVVSQGTFLLAAILRAGRPIAYSCRGQGVCVACRVRVDGPVSPPSPDEAALLKTLSQPANYRLACLCRALGDVTVRADYW